jgi:hypothetical protein
LLGVVSGRRPLALIDGGGKGFIVEIGDELFGYSVIGIGRKEVILKKHV